MSMRSIKRFNSQFASKFNRSGANVILKEITKNRPVGQVSHILLIYFMDFYLRTLDFSVKILLIHALRAEAHVLKQHFPGAVKLITSDGIELLSLDSRYDLLKTGVGLSRTRAALQLLPSPEAYDKILHFGVSGSLSKSLGLQTIVIGQVFTAHDYPQLTLSPSPMFLTGELKQITFHSSLSAIIDESLRYQAQSSGAEAVDMESYAVAEFCLDHGLELIAIRCISDRAGHTTATDFRQYFNLASTKLQNYLLQHILKVKRPK